MLADTSELDALSFTLATAAVKIIPALVPVAHTAGAKIKSTMRRDATGHHRLGQLPSTVSYDVNVAPTEIAVEVGFREEGQGKLATIVVAGTATTPPIMDVTRGLHQEVPAFMKWAAKVGAGVL